MQRDAHDRPRLPRRAVAALALFTSALVSGGCFIETQKYPGIMKPTSEPLPPGAKATFERGAEEAFVIRHSDSVDVRIAETNQKYALKFYDKRTRIPAGSWVHSGPTGHAEVILPGQTQVNLYGRGSGVGGAGSSRGAGGGRLGGVRRVAGCKEVGGGGVCGEVGGGSWAG